MTAARRIILTGIGGAVGSELAERLAGTVDAEIVGVFRSGASRDRFLARAGYTVRRLVRPVLCDLTDPGEVAAAAAALGRAACGVVVHAAANVSWTLDRAEAWRTNVDGTRNVAELARRTAERVRLVYVSSAFTRAEDWAYRNTYEESKAAAERALRRDHADLRPVVFSCSLVVGRSTDGRIARFHGIYPLLRLVETTSPPFLPGARDLPIDIVPVDWVADELATLTVRASTAADIPDVVASAGPQALPLRELVGLVIGVLNRRRREEGRPELADIPVLPFRRWDFLRRSVDAWRVSQIKLPDRRILEVLLESYRPYFEDGRALEPRHVSRPAPSSASYVDAVVGYWLRNSRRRPSAAAVH